MVSYILPILLLALLIGVSLSIGYICLELIVRMISRGLSRELATRGPAKISSYRIRTVAK
jgi:hypothetical protein